MSRSAVVGGCGFIGSRLAISLARAGDDVTVVDVAPPPDDLVGICRMESRDVTRPGSLRGVFDDADTVFLAAALLARQCDEDPDRCWAVNVAGTVHALSEIVAVGGSPRLVFLSSGSVYAMPAARYPVATSAATAPTDLYEQSKLAGEYAVGSAAAAGALSAVVLRPLTVYGPGPASGGRGHFVAGWMESAAAGRPLRIAGDGLQTVDLTHIDDVVQACRLAASATLAPGSCRVYNVGSGTETSVRDVARWFREVLPAVETVNVPARRSTPERRCLDITSSISELGYVARVDPETGVKALLRERLAQADVLPAHAGTPAVGA